MPFMPWLPGFEVGVAEFDEHHRHLVVLLDSVHKEFVGRTANTNIGEILDELIDYATYHFSAEESWMKKHNFPGLDAHLKEHAYFSHRVTEIQRDLVQGKKPPLLEVLTFIKNWISNHILVTDAEYGRFAATKVP